METKLTFAYKLCGLLIIWLASSFMLLAKANPYSDLPNEDITLSGTITYTESFCDLCNGSIDLTPVGGQLPYTYQWSDGQTTEDLTDLCVGFYQVTVTDALGCTYAGSQFVGNISYWDAILETQADVDDYIATYSNCPDVPGILRIGTLFAEPPSNITDISGLSFINSVGSSLLIFQNPNLTSLEGLQNINFVNNSVNINSNNALTSLEYFPNITTVNGNFFIDNHNNLTTLNGANSVSSITADLYIANCQALEGISALSNLQTISGKLDIRICTNLTNLNGLEQLSSIGGDLILSQDFNLNDISALDHPINIAGNLTILETNLSECSVESICTMLNDGAGSIVAENVLGCLTANQILQGCSGSDVDVSFDYVLPTCPQSCDGSIFVTASGSNPPFTYLWSTGSTDPLLASICSGFYELTITDNTGASSPFSVELFETPSLQVAYNILNPACFGSCDGEVIITVTGGTPPYTYDLPYDLCAGQTQVNITDANGCMIIQLIDMPGTEAYNLMLDNIEDASGGIANGSIDITIDGGSTPFNFTWTLNGAIISNLEDPSDLAPGDYNLTVADAEGCEQSFGPYTVGEMVSTNSLEQNKSISIFPNPTKESITIHFDKIIPAQIQYTLWNATGQQVLNGVLYPASSLEKTINISELDSAIYFLKLKTKNTTTTKKVFIQ